MSENKTMHQSAIRMKPARLILIVALCLASASCILADHFPIPQGGADIKVATPKSAVAVYTGMVDKIHQLGFKETSHDGTIFGEDPNKYWIEFELPEASIFAVTIAIDLDQDTGRVNYQYAEVKQRSDLKGSVEFSPDACRVIASLNSYASALVSQQANLEKMEIWGTRNCWDTLPGK
jgi:hypothetical protein